MTDYLDDVFGEGGHLSRAFAGYRPRPGQVAIARAIDRAIVEDRHLLAEGPTACHAAGQEILMFDGTIKKVEDVEVGDVLAGPTGPRTVLNLARGVGEMVDIVPLRGEPWRVNLDHILTLIHTTKGNLIDVRVRDWLTWSKTQKHLHKLVRCPAILRSDALTERRDHKITPYFLGVLLGDGTLHSDSVCVTKSDPEIVQSVHDEAAKFGLRVRSDDDSHFLSGPINHGRKKNPINSALKELNLKVKSERKFVPSSYKYDRYEIRAHVLAGLLDTDGSITRDGCTYDYISKSRQLAEDVKYLAGSIGLLATLRPCVKGYKNEKKTFSATYYRVTISGDTSIVPCRIQRKKANPRRQKKDPLRTGFKVIPAGIESFYGFSLDGDGRFLLGDFTITHNTGKSVAYSVPAIYHASERKKGPVIIVTANLALQSQIVEKDLPMLHKVLPWPFAFATAKGRQNFICTDKFESFDAELDAQLELRGPPEIARQLPVLRSWAQDNVKRLEQHGYRGDRMGESSQLPFVPVPELWRRVSTNADDCKGKRCKRRDVCFSNAAREAYRRADIIVTNYHLLLAHCAVWAETGMDLILPPFSTVICDEAHKIADIARDAFGFKLTDEKLKRVAKFVRKLGRANVADLLERSSRMLFYTLGDLRRDRERYKAELNVAKFTEDEKQVWTRTLEAAQACLSILRAHEADLRREFALMEDDSREAIDDAADKLGEAERRVVAAENCVAHLRAPIELATDGYVYFLEETDSSKVIVACKLVDPSRVLKRALFEKTIDLGEGAQGPRITVIATSATLATDGGSFDHARYELGVGDDADTVLGESPFTWKDQCLFVVPEGLPEPNDQTFKPRVGEILTKTILLAGGRTLGLFTSYHALQSAYDAVSPACRRQGIKLLRQGDESREKLIAEFKADTTSVLLGTESFWAGVDVPGESCSVVVIDRLPFPTPDDPIMCALIARDDKAFFKYAVPRAIIAFRQGFGRLVRSTTDRGVVICLDKRLITKSYGKRFLRALPDVPKTTNLDAIAEWLRKESA